MGHKDDALLNCASSLLDTMTSLLQNEVVIWAKFENSKTMKICQSDIWMIANFL